MKSIIKRNRWYPSVTYLSKNMIHAIGQLYSPSTVEYNKAIKLVSLLYHTKFRDEEVACIPSVYVEKIVGSKFYFCLLYTSPSPRDQRGSRMPSSA